MGDPLTLVERLEVAKATGLTTRIKLTPDEADAFAKLFRALDLDAMAVAAADRYARVQRVEDTATRVCWWFLIWCGFWSAYLPVYTMIQVF